MAVIVPLPTRARTGSALQKVREAKISRQSDVQHMTLSSDQLKRRAVCEFPLKTGVYNVSI